MVIDKSYCKHPNFDQFIFKTKVSIGPRSITNYSVAKITPKEFRKMKKIIRKMFSEGLSVYEHGFFECKGCKNCQGA
ncbi:hypothetical protein ACQ31_gp075 [Salmonella phage STML-198]|uniref:Uncharacterized protein n=1 Tax=Salmonella phage STML-198 TaxID=1204531 RepID=K4I2L9_9CAUD|nr:hypothetical protein ACQ31_gp075 [Salmonella phage STML-198]AFU63958.1 hypothetical protein [Salmonella phage STML-198]